MDITTWGFLFYSPTIISNNTFLSFFYNSDIKIRLASGPNQKDNEVYGHKFVMATRNESWGKADLHVLGKNC